MPRRKAKAHLVAPDRAWWLGELAASLHERWQQGAKDYGNRSFEMRPLEISLNVLQELIDVPGWLFVLSASRAAELLPPNEEGQGQFLRAVRDRIASGNFKRSSGKLETPEAILEEIVRLAAIGACHWWQMRQEITTVYVAINVGYARRDKAKPIVEPPTRVGRRGGLVD